MILAIVLTIIICATVVTVALLFTNPRMADLRDSNAQARDRGLARIYEARANALALETNHKRAEASRLQEWQREQSRKHACDDAREPDEHEPA